MQAGRYLADLHCRVRGISFKQNLRNPIIRLIRDSDNRLRKKSSLPSLSAIALATEDAPRPMPPALCPLLEV